MGSNCMTDLFAWLCVCNGEAAEDQDEGTAVGLLHAQQEQRNSHLNRQVRTTLENLIALPYRPTILADRCGLLFRMAGIVNGM